MNSIRIGIPFALAFVTLSGAALAADEAPVAPAVQTATVATPATVTPKTAATATSASRSSNSAKSANNADVRRMFCLNMAMQCFSVQQAAANSTTPDSTTASLRRLDLHAPDIRRIVPDAQLREPIQDEYEVLQETEQVQVEGVRPEIYVPGGLMSLPWAVMNPTQAWRIFLPVNSTK
jgi:hypothetical protein